MAALKSAKCTSWSFGDRHSSSCCLKKAGGKSAHARPSTATSKTYPPMEYLHLRPSHHALRLLRVIPLTFNTLFPSTYTCASPSVLPGVFKSTLCDTVCHAQVFHVHAPRLTYAPYAVSHLASAASPHLAPLELRPVGCRGRARTRRLCATSDTQRSIGDRAARRNTLRRCPR